jgi:hypothetical protein
LREEFPTNGAQAIDDDKQDDQKNGEYDENSNGRDDANGQTL